MASAIRGSRVGAGPMGEAERGDQIERATVSYWCGNGHEVAIGACGYAHFKNGV